MENYPKPYPAKNIEPALNYGGWGSLTAGMLDINQGVKSYGVFGQAGATSAETEPVNGITYDFRSITDNSEQCLGDKYMMVTVMPKYDDETFTHSELKMSLNAYKWGDFKKNKSLLKPPAYDEFGQLVTSGKLLDPNSNLCSAIII